MVGLIALELLLDKRPSRGIYCAIYIPSGNTMSSELGAPMDREEKVGELAGKMTHYNMFLAEAIFDLLAEKGILTGEEVKERIMKLKEEIPSSFRWMQ